MTAAIEWTQFCFAVLMAWVTICLVGCFVGWVLAAVFNWHHSRKKLRDEAEAMRVWNKAYDARMADDWELQEAMRHV